MHTACWRLAARTRRRRKRVLLAGMWRRGEVARAISGRFSRQVRLSGGL